MDWEEKAGWKMGASKVLEKTLVLSDDVAGPLDSPSCVAELRKRL